MKRSVRSTLDPLPRSISLRSLALLVAMLLSGVGVSVREYLDSQRAHNRPFRPAASAPGEFTRDEQRHPASTAPSWQPRPEPSGSTPSGSTSEELAIPKPHPTAATQAPVPTAPTEARPEGETMGGSAGERVGAVSER